MQLIEQHKITSTGLAPAMINFILNHPRTGDYDLSTIRMLKYGASPMPLEVLRTTMSRFGPVAQALFGMTELAGTVTFLSEEDHVRAAQGDDHLLASCGRPGPLCSVRVVDEAMTECAPGMVGEIVVRGEQVSATSGLKIIAARSARSPCHRAHPGSSRAVPIARRRLPLVSG